MELTQQIHSNECGVCAINTLFKHYYKRDIKSKLLEEANITGNGLNIYDFELLCHKHGILTEVYSISENELKDLEINDVFVTMVSNDLGNHYVIVKKKNKCFEI
jgi:ABC-type bacteriocin/lantibiotic exporter with double-glycine peptidase domain